MEQSFAQKFGREWVEAGNTHDLDKILLHYTDDFELSSPIIKVIANEESGVLKGKEVIKTYWSKALQLNPNLNFEFINAFTGVNSVIVNYKGHRGLSSEVFFFNEQGKVYKSCAHYEKYKSYENDLPTEKLDI